MTALRDVRWGRFWWHYAEMVVAMAAGMMLLPMLWPPIHGVEAHTLAMATNMTIGMAVPMLIRRHSWRSILEMAAAMFVPFLVFFPPMWAGWISADTMSLAGHILMLLAMAGVMLLRPAEYTCHATPIEKLRSARQAA